MTTTRIGSGWFLAAVICMPAAVARAGVIVGDSPKLSATAIDGTAIDLEKFRGKLVLIDFWAGRADSCKINERKLQEIHRDYKDQGLVIIGICCDRKLEWANKYISDLSIRWPQVHEPEDFRGGIGKEWGVTRINWEFLLAPDGKVIFTGPVEQVREAIESALIKHPPQLVEPTVLAKANEELDVVEALLRDKDSEGAIRKFTRLGDEAMKDRPYASRNGAVRGKINEVADALLADVDKMLEAKQYPAAAARLKELLAVMSGLPTASLARQRLAELTSDPNVQQEMDLFEKREKAEAALADARKVRDSGEQEAAYRKFKAVAQDYPDTPAGKSAADAAKAYEADTAFVQRLHDREVEAKAKPALALAENYRAAGQVEKARRKYEEVLKNFAGTTFADTARRELERLR